MCVRVYICKQIKELLDSLLQINKKSSLNYVIIVVYKYKLFCLCLEKCT